MYQQDPSPLALRSFLDDHAAGRYNIEFIEAYRSQPNSIDYIEASKQAVESIYNRDINIPMLGASGAVFGILMAFGMLFPNIELFLIFCPRPIKANYFVRLYGAYAWYAGFNRIPGDNVAHFAHLGGMLFAYILVKMWERQQYDRF
ncbi:MAG: rhomboid family intramembrane serine protease [Hymenobacteraceae bacterium]|nr:rhomboid family intramembrane serine protease [Hymenobacteraceae bacterium]MDX5397699.1 rhomboid family intramembrane serine protease [Hymenobacteraceae bacterium]MDX5513777.1 rhomboid family intramembrane serine protease [Hymenobacteraceae bacterium]